MGAKKRDEVRSQRGEDLEAEAMLARMGGGRFLEEGRARTQPDEVKDGADESGVT